MDRHKFDRHRMDRQGSGYGDEYGSDEEEIELRQMGGRDRYMMGGMMPRGMGGMEGMGGMGGMMGGMMGRHYSAPLTEEEKKAKAERKALEEVLAAQEAERAAIMAKRKFDEGVKQDIEDNRGDGDWVSDDERFTPSKVYMKSEDYWYEFSFERESDYYNKQLRRFQANTKERQAQKIAWFDKNMPDVEDAGK